jgi:hypothetical protein
LALGRHFDSGRIDFTPGQLRVVQHRVRRPCEFSKIAHQFTLASLWSRRTCHAQRAEEARFEKTSTTYIAVKNAHRCEWRRLHPGKPGKARLMDADHLLGGERLPGAAKARISPH